MITAGILAVGGGCGYSGLNTIRRIINNQLAVNAWEYKTFRWCTNGLPFIDKVEQILGGKYVILLQNNTELRPTGGFAGSYAVIDTNSKGIRQIRVQDIYEPDGKLPGHVEPPYPIQEAFGQGWWKLRDANWDIDFASSAGAMKWFFEQGGESNISGIIGVNLNLLDQVLKITGPIRLTTYDETVTDKNLYTLAQKYAEARITGNKTDKRGFLGAVGAALEIRIRNAKLKDVIKLAGLIFGELKKGEILVWMNNPEIQKEIEFRKWGGRITKGEGDYLYVVDTNLGANKANCCIDRDIRIEVSPPSLKASEGQVTQQKITVTWKNNNEFENPKPPVFWGGDYRNYVRVVIPANKKIVSVSVGGKLLRQASDKDFQLANALRRGISDDIFVVEERGELQIVGFWAVVGAGQQVKAELEYINNAPSDPPLNLRGGKLLFKHQPGSGMINYQVLVDGTIEETGKLDRDVIIRLWTR